MTFPLPNYAPWAGPVLPPHLRPAALELERDLELPLWRTAIAVDELVRAGTPQHDAVAVLGALIDDASRHEGGRHTCSASLLAAEALARHRGVRGRVEPAGRVLLVRYDLRTPELIPWAGGQAHEVIGDQGLTVTRSAPVVDEHAGPQLGVVVAAEVNAGRNLALYVELAPGAAQDELLARAYFGDGPIGTSIRTSDDPRRTRVDKGRVPQVTRRGVTVLHLAFCADPMRDSTVQRAYLPTTPPTSRGARDVHGVLGQLPATRSTSTPDARRRRRRGPGRGDDPLRALALAAGRGPRAVDRSTCRSLPM